MSADIRSLREEVVPDLTNRYPLDDDDTDHAALKSQVDRHEGWINQLARKTDTDLVVDA